MSVFTTYFFASTVIQSEDLVNADLMSIRPDDIVNGQIAALVGLLLLLAGYCIPIGRIVPGGIPTPRRDWTFRATLIVALFMIPLGWIICPDQSVRDPAEARRQRLPRDDQQLDVLRHRAADAHRTCATAHAKRC